MKKTICILTTLISFFVLSNSYGQVNYDTTCVVSRLNFKLLDWSVIDDESITEGNLEGFLNEQGLEYLAQFADYEIDLGNLYLRKSFSFLKTSDSLSMTRQGEVINVPPFWATFNIKIPEGMNYEQFLKLSNDAYPLVIYAHPNYQIEYFNSPNDTLYVGQESLNIDSLGIFADSAWTIETGERWIKVGVFDTGIDSTHEDLSVLTGWYGGQLDSVTWGVDIDGHGTQVAGIIGARRNNDSTGVAGIAGGNGSDTSGVSLLDFRNGLGGIEFIENWCASIINSVRVPGTYFDWDMNSGEVGNIYQPFYYENAPGYGVHVNNFSSGFRIDEYEKGGPEDPPQPSGPAFFEDCRLCYEAFLFSIRNGVVSTASRGNPPLANGNPATYEGARIYPAGFHDSWVISTGSSGNDGERLIQGQNSSSLYFSPNGQDIDIIAPGSFDIVKTTESSNVDSTILYGQFDGTSAAAPHTAGVAALLLSHYNKAFCYSNLNLDPADIEYIIQNSATHTQENYNSGSYDYHPGSGWGRLNAFEALKMIDFPEYQIVHPEMPYIGRQTVAVDTISINYEKPLNDIESGPLGAGFPLELNEVYKVIRYKEQLVYDFGQYMLDSTILLDAWVRHGPTNSAILNNDTTKIYEVTGGVVTDSSVIGDYFSIEQMAYIDSIVDDSLIYLSGYYYEFIEMYSDEDINALLYTDASIPVSPSYWYPYDPYNPQNDLPLMAYSIYIRDTTLLTRYDFPCIGDNELLDLFANMEEHETDIDFEVYPNPGAYELNIVLGNTDLTGAKITLIDATGRIVNHVDVTQSKIYTLDVAHLKTGLYFVHLTSPRGIQKSKKWIKH